MADGHRRSKQLYMRRILPAASMLLLAAGGFFLLSPLLSPPGSEPEPTPITTPEATPIPTPAPTPAPPFQALPRRYVPLQQADGRAVPQREDQCFWGMDLLDMSALLHRCRFTSGSGELLPDYRWGQPVPETAAVEDSFFSDAVFLGNSLEQGFMLYAGLETGDMFATQSINVNNIYTEAVISSGGQKLTLLDAMARKQYAKVYVLLGINELSYLDESGFYDRYARLIDDIRTLEPGAELYLQAITPVTAAMTDRGGTFTNPRIHAFNEVIRQLAADKEAHYVHIYDALADEDGCLPAGSTQDGIHPYPKYYPQILTYLKTHTVTEVQK